MGLKSGYTPSKTDREGRLDHTLLQKQALLRIEDDTEVLGRVEEVLGAKLNGAVVLASQGRDRRAVC